MIKNIILSIYGEQKTYNKAEFPMNIIKNKNKDLFFFLFGRNIGFIL